MMRARERRLKALSMLISDEEMQDLIENKKKDKGECAVCFDQASLQPFLTCEKHKICKGCTMHASQSDVFKCALCPVPPPIFHVQCPCLNIFFSHSLQCKCSCGNEFIPKLSRLFKRGPHTYTNFLEAKDKAWIRDQFNKYGGCVWCPTCGQGLQRSSACNELYHCGVEKVCACCGQFNFRFEKGMVEHRKEKGCASFFEGGDEQEMTRKRLEEQI